MICAICGNTGFKESGHFCVCTNGEIKRNIARAKAQSEKKAEEEQKAKASRRREIEEKPVYKQLNLVEVEEKAKPFKPGDWVGMKTNKARGVIIENGRGTRSYVSFIFDERGRPFEIGDGSKVWKDWDILELIPVAKPTKLELLDMIDFAIDTGDKEWFEQLSNELRELEGKISFSG